MIEEKIKLKIAFMLSEITKVLHNVIAFLSNKIFWSYCIPYQQLLWLHNSY